MVVVVVVVVVEARLLAWPARGVARVAHIANQSGTTVPLSGTQRYRGYGCTVERYTAVHGGTRYTTQKSKVGVPTNPDPPVEAMPSISWDRRKLKR
eukprot:scaffold33270_cov48-Cyclotella_meneghiniana.AAC.2